MPQWSFVFVAILFCCGGWTARKVLSTQDLSKQPGFQPWLLRGLQRSRSYGAEIHFRHCHLHRCRACGAPRGSIRTTCASVLRPPRPRLPPPLTVSTCPLLRLEDRLPRFHPPLPCLRHSLTRLQNPSPLRRHPFIRGNPRLLRLRHRLQWQQNPFPLSHPWTRASWRWTLEAWKRRTTAQRSWMVQQQSWSTSLK